MNRRIVLSTGVFLLIASALLGVAVVLAQSGDNGPSAAADEHIQQVPESARSVPELNDDQIEDIERLIGLDPRLKSALNETNYTISRIGPWVSGSGKELVGGIAELILDESITYEGSVPLVRFKPDPDSEKQYEDNEFNVQAQEVTSLYVLVDLGEGSVVGIEVAEAESVDYSEKTEP